jgi:hypothetical protein
MIPDTVERVRLHTADEINRRIERETNERVRFFAANPAGIERRLRELDAEWDIERLLEANAATLAFAGTALAATVHKRWLALPRLFSFSMQSRAGVRRSRSCGGWDIARRARSRPSA